MDSSLFLFKFSNPKIKEMLCGMVVSGEHVVKGMKMFTGYMKNRTGRDEETNENFARYCNSILQTKRPPA